MSANHIVYFIGGPLDLTKRSFPGYEPAANILRFPLYPNRATYHSDNEPLEMGPVQEAAYELASAWGPDGKQVWIGVLKP